MMDTAIVFIDLQNDFRKIITPELVKNIATLVKYSRNKKTPIFWVRSVYDCEKKYDYDGEFTLDVLIQRTHCGKNKFCVRGTENAEFVPEISDIIDGEDCVIEKNWYSCFKNTELDNLLLQNNIKNIIIGGVTTNMCVLASLFDGFKHGFNVSLAVECTNAFSLFRHCEAMNKIKTFGNVKTNNELISELCTFCEGDSRIIYDVIPKEIYDLNIISNFLMLRDEVKWHHMNQFGKPIARLVSVQGIVKDGLTPLYRKPADEQPELVEFTPIIDKIRIYLSKLFDQELNHAFIQLYRDGTDHIGEHADKTLDIKIGSKIINFSIGATRVMTLRPKPKYNKDKQHVALHNNSVFCIGWDSNKKWLHGVPQDKNIKEERISIVFRTIATFVDKNCLIIGQGAPKIINDIDDSIDMVKAFGVENRDPDFDWATHYGCGFKSINFKTLI